MIGRWACARACVYALCLGSLVSVFLLVSVLLPSVSRLIVPGVSVVVLGCGWFGVVTIGFGEVVVGFGVARVRLVLVVAMDTVVDVVVGVVSVAVFFFVVKVLPISYAWLRSV